MTHRVDVMYKMYTLSPEARRESIVEKICKRERYVVEVRNCKTEYTHSKYKHSLTFPIRRYVVMCPDCKSARWYVVLVTKPMHRLQIRPTVHN